MISRISRGKCYQRKPQDEADNPYRNLDYSGYQKMIESNDCFIIMLHMVLGRNESKKLFKFNN